MKKTLLFIGIALYSLSSFAQSINNSSFENWVNMAGGIYRDPSSWQSVNAISLFVCGEANVLRNSTPHAGTYAAELKTLPTNDNPNIGFPGVLNQNIAVSNRPENLTGYYKFSSPNIDDAGVVIITITKFNASTGESDLVGFGEANLDPRNSFTKFEAEIQYDPTYDGVTPDSMSIIIVSSSASDNDGELIPGGILIIDNLSLTYLNNSNKNIPENLISIFPNPANTTIHIQADPSIKNMQISIFDLNGKEMMVSPQTKIDVADLKPGIYIIQVKSNDAILNKKILIN